MGFPTCLALFLVLLRDGPEVLKIDLPFDEAIRRALKVKPERREAKKPTPKKAKAKKKP